MPRQVSLAFLSPSPPGSCTTVPCCLWGPYNPIEHHWTSCQVFRMTLASISHERSSRNLSAKSIMGHCWKTCCVHVGGDTVQILAMEFMTRRATRAPSTSRSLRPLETLRWSTWFDFFLILFDPFVGSQMHKKQWGFSCVSLFLPVGRNNFMRTFAWR